MDLINSSCLQPPHSSVNSWCGSHDGSSFNYVLFWMLVFVLMQESPCFWSNVSFFFFHLSWLSKTYWTFLMVACTLAALSIYYSIISFPLCSSWDLMSCLQHHVKPFSNGLWQVLLKACLCPIWKKTAIYVAWIQRRTPIADTVTDMETTQLFAKKFRVFLEARTLRGYCCLFLIMFFSFPYLHCNHYISRLWLLSNVLSTDGVCLYMYTCLYIRFLC